MAIPQTKQGVRRPQPIRPAVPIPVETDIIPEDVTIAPTTLDLNMASVGSMGGAPANEIYQARPLAFVFPQYPEEERKRGVRGEIKVSLEIDEKGKVVNVTILSNDTGSELCAQAAMKAAFATRFAPARDKKGPVTSWLILPYRFDYQK